MNRTRTINKALEEVEEGIMTINPVEDGVITTGITKEINQTSVMQSNSVDTLQISTYLRTSNTISSRLRPYPSIYLPTLPTYPGHHVSTLAWDTDRAAYRDKSGSSKTGSRVIWILV